MTQPHDGYEGMGSIPRKKATLVRQLKSVPLRRSNYVHDKARRKDMQILIRAIRMTNWRALDMNRLVLPSVVGTPNGISGYYGLNHFVISAVCLPGKARGNASRPRQTFRNRAL